ncbi:hypothetical protein [Halorientalis salina]|uniref:hypothetical protein n=1 Tax=Halorientalis salina TaxID=2932266 RepID=UPI0010AB7E33|nr:hypothetical protein [Halorientalis salina]
MSVVPGSIDTGQQPPMTIPLRHFVVGLGFLLAGVVLGVGVVSGIVSGLAGLAHVHLLLVGWICLTIMGAMTQFVPVWSGVELHSRKLASVQLWLVTLGLAGFAVSLLAVSFPWLVAFGAVMLCGFWTFAYNVGRTLSGVEDFDVTERHFALALGYFVLVTALGLLLASDFSAPVFDALPVTRTGVVGAHATLAVFGAVLTTVFGALYQLATMFTQTELHGVDNQLRTIEEVAYPLGVVGLAGGRLLDLAPLARTGGILVILSVLSISVVLGRKLYETRVEWTPMLSRYTVVVPALAAWALLTIPHWLWNATAPATRFGAPGASHLLALGGIGFVVLGTLYHIVPFIIWVHRYSDLLGFEDVPMIDDLYDDRLAAADCTLFVSGTALLIGTALFDRPDYVAAIGGVIVTLGVVVFAANMLLVIREHSPQSLSAILLSRGDTETSEGASEEKPA